MTVRLHRRSGATLIELLVVLAIVAGLAAGASLSLHNHTDAGREEAVTVVVDLSRRSIMSGVPVSATVMVDDRPARVLALPDGRIIGAHGLRRTRGEQQETHGEVTDAAHLESDRRTVP